MKTLVLTLTATLLWAQSAANTTDLINDCERRTNSFKGILDKALGRNNVRAGQAREDDLNRAAKRLEDAFDKVGDAWNKDHNQEATRQHLRNAITIASDINRAMRNWRMGPEAETEWRIIRGNLNQLARTFNLPRLR